MDIKVDVLTDKSGTTYLDLCPAMSPTGHTLPVRSGIWLLDEMRSTATFQIQGNTLKIDDPLAYMDAGTLVMETDATVRTTVLQQLSGEKQTEQRAFLAVFLQKGSIPQLPDTGNFAAELLTGQHDMAEYNAQALQNIQDLAGTLAYKPNYVVKDGMVYVEVGVA